jgi:plasmid stabilization system protein ParE
MTLALAFLPEAAEELDQARDYYESEMSGLGSRLLDRVEAATHLTIIFPDAAPIIEGSIRRKLISGFPYGILYRHKSDMVLIIAIMNLNRQPGYWRKRL